VSDKTYCTLCAIAAVACFVVVALLWQPAPIPEEVWLQYKASHPQQNAGAVANREAYDTHPAKASDYWFARQLRGIAQYCNQTPDSKVDEWIEKFVCEIKVTDVAVAGFTGVLAIFTLALAIATGVLIGVGLSQASHLKSSVDVAAGAAKEAKDAIEAIQATATAAITHAVAAEEANKINRELLITSQRPWLSIEPAPEIISSLVFNEIGATVTIKFIVKNVGRSPALHAWPFTRLILHGGDSYQMAQQALRQMVTGSPNTRYGFTVFPDPSQSAEITVTVEPDQIAEAIKRFKARIVMPIIAGVVFYRMPFSQEFKETGFAYNISRIDGDEIKGDEGEIPKAQLYLHPMSMLGGASYAT
jgi:hypothetical protein